MPSSAAASIGVEGREVGFRLRIGVPVRRRDRMGVVISIFFLTNDKRTPTIQQWIGTKEIDCCINSQ